MEWNLAHRNLSGIATESNFKNYPIRNIVSFLCYRIFAEACAEDSAD